MPEIAIVIGSSVVACIIAFSLEWVLIRIGIRLRDAKIRKLIAEERTRFDG